MAKYCAFCVKKLGAFSGSYSIINTDYEYCLERVELIERLNELLDYDYTADASEIINKFKNSLDNVSADFENAVKCIETQKRKAMAETVEERKFKEQQRLREDERRKEERERQRKERERKGNNSTS